MVISVVIVLAGLISIPLLPVGEFPDVSPPQVQVTAAFPGANAQTVIDAVAGPIEQEVNGVEGMIYMQSTAANDGSYTLTVTFEFGTDPDLAQVNVQNRVSQAEPLLPEEVKRQGVRVKKQSTDMLMIVNVYSPDGSLDPEFISNYATINVSDVGQGEVDIACDIAAALAPDSRKLNDGVNCLATYFATARIQEAKL